MKTISPLKNNSKLISVNCGRDKSLTHRAVMFSSLSQGKSRILNPLLGADCISTMNCFRKLGVSIQIGTGEIELISPGFKHFKTPSSELDCGNSGTTARLFLGLFAGIEGLAVTLIGDESLSQRPMDRVVNPLRNVGGKFQGRENSKFLPITIQGSKILAGSHSIDKATAQVKSALLLASLNSTGPTVLTLPAGSRDHTERMLRQMGADCQTKISGDLETITFTGPFTIPSGEFNIPVDPSSAAFFSVFGLLRPEGMTLIPDVLDNDTRTGFLVALKRMSPKISVEKPKSQQVFVEATMDLKVEGSLPLQGTDISEEEVPTLVDEIPILAVAAAFATTPSRFKGLGELRVKESDRLKKTHELLQLVGAACKIENDDLLISGGLKRANCFQFDTEGDHRLAMAAAVLAKFADGPCRITRPDCVDVSFPNFYEELEKFEY